MKHNEYYYKNDIGDSKPKILWISYCAPYDTVPHAGGKIHNFYLKGLNKTGNYDVSLITLGGPEVIDKIDLKKYGISFHLIIDSFDGSKRNMEYYKRMLHRWNFVSKDVGFITPFAKRKLKESIKKIEYDYNPNLIILQWTQIILLLPIIRKRFPDVPVIAIEEDVSYLANKRRYESEKNWIKKLVRKKLYISLREKELEMLEKCEITICNNYKDEYLLKNDNKNIRTYVWCPYFQSMIDVERIGGTKDIIFYGAMSREENWKSAIWFIENVMPLLDCDVRFIVIGNSPPKELMKYKSERVIIAGFVDDVSEFFSKALCLVAPLVLGAGVKIKVLEALSSGIPVLTNNIGIEGIDAVDGESFYLCSNPNDYVRVINILLNKEIEIERVSKLSKELIRKKYNMDQSLKDFCGLIDSMVFK